MAETSESQIPLKELSAKEKAFVHEYCLDLNGSQACIRAGYCPTTPESAASIATRLLASAHVSQAVERLQAQRLQRINVTAENVLAEMHLLANSSLEHYVVEDDGQVKPAEGAPDGCMRAIQSIKRKTTVRTDKDGSVTKTYDVEIKLWDKPNPLKLMGKQVGAFPEKVELVGKDGGPVQVERVERVVIDPKGGQ